MLRNPDGEGGKKFIAHHTISLFDSECRYLHRSPELPDGFPRSSEFIGKTLVELSDDPEMGKGFAEWMVAQIPSKGDSFDFGFPYRFKNHPDLLFFFCQATRVQEGGVEYCINSYAYPIKSMELTSSEQAVIAQVGKGNGVKAAAKEMCCSVSTVHSHINRMKKKLGIANIEQFTAFASFWHQSNVSESMKEFGK